ncbi:MAG: GxxExxY protein [Chryseobacterium sp.]|nr:GxxExxY protein [Chryseobacterium sp.]MCJ7935414.1 GxxExxY protein [Chryseobacterium sp.]
MTENELSCKIIGEAIEVRKNLGVGLLENAYETYRIHRIVNKCIDE